uniref:Uncharacterized protein n=1 Tax=Corethron hystrix TaxID=216773 RepID=A0A7S1FJY5_9STRA
MSPGVGSTGPPESPSNKSNSSNFVNVRDLQTENQRLKDMLGRVTAKLHDKDDVIAKLTSQVEQLNAILAIKNASNDGSLEVELPSDMGPNNGENTASKNRRRFLC